MLILGLKGLSINACQTSWCTLPSIKRFSGTAFYHVFVYKLKIAFVFIKKTLLFLYMDPVDYDVDVKKYMYKRTVPFNLIAGRNKCFLFILCPW